MMKNNNKYLEKISRFIDYYNLSGLLVGFGTFLIIGIFHPLVIKGEYYFGVQIWWLFFLSGVFGIIASISTRNFVISTLLAVWGASSFWGIGELFEQRQRVLKGWFPKRVP